MLIVCSLRQMARPMNAWAELDGPCLATCAAGSFRFLCFDLGLVAIQGKARTKDSQAPIGSRWTNTHRPASLGFEPLRDYCALMTSANRCRLGGAGESLP